MRLLHILLKLLVTAASITKGFACTNVPKLHQIRERWFNNWFNGNSLINDFNLQTGWYSMLYNGRTYRLADSNITWNHGMCGTFYPIYLQDQHPDISQITQTPVTATVCVLDTNTDCDDTYTVKIRLCPGNDLQYYLGPTLAYAGYCLDDAGLPYNVSEIPPPSVLLTNVSVIVRLQHHVNRTTFDEFIPETQFHCMFSVQKELYYSVDWFVDRRPLRSVAPTSDTSAFVLTDRILVDANVTLPFYVRCSVRVSVYPESQKTDAVYSTDFFAGAKIDKYVLVLPKNGQTEISVKTTIPIGCRYHSVLRDYPDVCLLTLQITNTDRKEKKCPALLNTQYTDIAHESISLLSCTKAIKALQANDTFDPDIEYKFPIATVDDTYNDKTEFQLDIRFEQIKYGLWNGYVLPPVKVIVANSDVNRDKTCHSRVDPHLKTVDGLFYEQQAETGEFMLYWNTKYDIEVQQKTHRCNWGVPNSACACGVAVRAGKDVFMINTCGSLNYMDFTHCGEGGILEVIYVTSDRYRILTPIGTKVEVMIHGKDMNINIFLAPKDLNNIEGLCGTFDNDKTNDFKHYNSDYKTSHTSHYPDDFSKSWNMAQTTKEIFRKKNLFREANRTLEYWKTRNQLYCLCNGTRQDNNAVAVCSPKQYLDCNISGSITPMKCHVNTGFRKRRDTRSHEKELNRLFAQMQKPRVAKHTVDKRQTYTISEEEATLICENRINETSAFSTMASMTVSEDRKQVIADCVYDLQISGDQHYADIHVDTVNNVVKTMLYNQPDFVANNMENVNLFLQTTCPFNCSGKGNCTLMNGEGVCLCNMHYHGAACTIDERTPVIIDDIEGGGECDIAEGEDCKCFTIRVETLIPNFRCNITTYKHDVNVSIHLIASNQGIGIYEDIYTGRCCAEQGIADIQDAFSVTYSVSVSNDGVNYGEEENVYIYSSVCQRTEEMDDIKKTVLLAVDLGCFIDGGCIANGQLASFDDCLACNGTLDPYSYSQDVCIHNTTTTVVQDTTTTVHATTTTAPDTISTVQDISSTVQDTITTVQDRTSAVEDTTSTVQDTTNTVQDTTITVQNTTISVQKTTITVQDITTTEKDTTSTVQDTTTTLKYTTSTVQDITTTGHDTTTTVQDTTATVQDTTTTAQETTTTVHDTTVTVQDTTSTVQDTTTTVKDTTTTVKDTTATVQDTTSTIKDTTSTVKDTTSTVKDTTATIQDTNTTVQETTTTVQDTTSTVKDTTSTVKATTATVQDTTTTVQETTTTVQDTTATVQDTTATVPVTTTTVQETTTTVQDTTTIVQDTTSTVQDTTTIVRDTTSTVQDTTTTVQDTTTTVQNTTTAVLDTTTTVQDTITTVHGSTTTGHGTITTVPDTTTVEDTTTAVQDSTSAINDTTSTTLTTTGYPSSAREAHTFITYVAVIPSAIAGSMILIAIIALSIGWRRTRSKRQYFSEPDNIRDSSYSTGKPSVYSGSRENETYPRFYTSTVFVPKYGIRTYM